MGRLAVAGVCLLWVALVADELDAALGDTTIVEETAGFVHSPPFPRQPVCLIFTVVGTGAHRALHKMLSRRKMKSTTC